jgi:hypothetical protein
MNEVNGRPAEKPLEPFMIGKGKEIRKQIPVWIRRKLLELSKLFASPDGPRPTVLIVSDEANIPWELAYLHLDGAEPREDFLGAAFVVGRWVRGYPDVHGNQVPTYPPPTDLRIGSMAIVTGDYSGAKYWAQLEGAIAEANELADRYHATPVNADSQLVSWLADSADFDLIHFAVHGKWTMGDDPDGIVLGDGSTLRPDEVLGVTLKNKPFVFLNACQLGQGKVTLGDYGGIAAAFLEAGASGVVAALWNVDDKQARELATRFYSEMQQNATGPGEVFRRQRATFAEDTGSKLSLAYQFFGHPQMRMTLEDELLK